MKICKFLFAMLLSLQVSAQTLSAPPVPGWQSIRSCSGDLDGDGADDLVVVYRAIDASKKVPTHLPSCDEIDLTGGPGRFLVDQNPRKLVVFLQRPQGLTPIATAPFLIPASTVTEGEHLDHLVLRPRELDLGLLFMNRRHGEVVHRLYYRFSWDGKNLKLDHLFATHFDRYVDRQEQRYHYDLEKGQLSLQKLQFPDQTPVSEQQSRIADVAPGLEELTPDWRPQNAR